MGDIGKSPTGKNWAEFFNFETFSAEISQGFSGFKTIAELGTTCESVPESAGVYIILASSPQLPTFCLAGSASIANGDTPKSADVLAARWNDQTAIIYIGKAGGPTYKTTLRKRLQTYMRYGQGRKAQHKGGRDIWQISNVMECLVAWRVSSADEDPRKSERVLIEKFKGEYKALPFANRKK